jgi:predicted O-methyltransferase YrrM
MTDDPSAKIRAFWDAQAAQFGADPRATTPDHWMREVEIEHLARIVSALPPGRALDIGCGNGYSTLKLAAACTAHRFIGGDFAPAMVASARKSLAEAPPAVASRVAFEVMDAASFTAAEPFDAVLSDRCLINLPEKALQWRALERIASALKPGGTYLAVENFLSGQRELNRLRAEAGLPPIEIRWHNLFFDDDEFRAEAGRHFDVVADVPISSLYYLVTRVVYTRWCRDEGREPGYDHPLYRVAARLPAEGNYGPIRLIHLRRR